MIAVSGCMPMLHDATPTPDLRFRCECSASCCRIEEVVICSHNSIEAFFPQTQAPKTAGIALRLDSKSLVPR